MSVVAKTAAESEDHTDQDDYYPLGIHYVQQMGQDRIGLVVSTTDKAQSARLCRQMAGYFLATGEGQTLSASIVPEPFFVHSDLTTAVQLADIVGYVLNWGFMTRNTMTEPRRDEIKPFADMVFSLSYKGSH
jgi:hypothetical protein